MGPSDFRSDTVTRPTPAMYEAMMTAPLGDDVLGDDPTVRELEDYAASEFGTEAALFVPSGTMANQIAARVHTGRGDEVILEEGSHCFYYEAAGLAQLSGLQCRTLPGEQGRIDPDRLAAAVRSDDVHYPRTRLVVLENTHNRAGGAVLPLEYLDEVFALTRRLGLRLHLDGARIANASAATGVSLAEYGARTDSISCCLSKGLGAPVGTVLMGSRELIHQSRRARKVFGGGMRQAGILAAAGLIALRDMRDRLADDHRRARELAAGLSKKRGHHAAAPETNLVYVDVEAPATEVVAFYEAHGVRGMALDAHRIRFVTHLDVGDDDVARAIAVPALGG